MESVGDLDELRCDAQALAGLSDAAFEHRINMQFGADLADVLAFSLEREG
jgi:hypothetical protein